MTPMTYFRRYVRPENSHHGSTATTMLAKMLRAACAYQNGGFSKHWLYCRTEGGFFPLSLVRRSSLLGFVLIY